MKWMIGTLVLLMAISMVAQQAPQAITSSPAAAVVPDNDVRHDIASVLATSPELNNTAVSVTVNSDEVMLNGYVTNEEQHDYALQVANDNANGRQVVDDIQLGGISE